ncbi:hypothetical protein [Candidatus Nitrospira bockiana]
MVEIRVQRLGTEEVATIVMQRGKFSQFILKFSALALRDDERHEQHDPRRLDRRPFACLSGLAVFAIMPQNFGKTMN